MHDGNLTGQYHTMDASFISSCFSLLGIHENYFKSQPSSRSKKHEPLPLSFEIDADFHQTLAQLKVSPQYSINAGELLIRRFEQGEAGIRLLEVVGQQGDPTSMVCLATIYLEGKSVERDVLRAMTYFVSANDLGSTEAKAKCTEVWSKHCIGEITTSPHQALKFLELGARAKIPDALHKLGMRYLNGQGVQQDSKKAIVDFLCPASYAGHAESSHELGMLYLEGKMPDVKRDVWTGILFLQAAVRHGREETFILKETANAVLIYQTDIPNWDSKTARCITVNYKGEQYSVPTYTGKLSNVKKIVLSAMNTERTYYFKSFFNGSPGLGTAARIAGIPMDPRARNFPYRTMFAYLMAKRLGFDVIPKTGFFPGDSTLGAGYIMQEAGSASLIEFLCVLHMCDSLENKSGVHKIGSNLLEIRSDSVIVRKLNQLQLLYALIGNVDPHGNNIRINWDTKEIFGIDNDFCGGKFTEHPNQPIEIFRYDGFVSKELTKFEENLLSAFSNQEPDVTISDYLDKPGGVGRAVLLSPVMDEHMVAQLSTLTHKDIVDIMTPLYFTQPEIVATQKRLNAIQFHITVLKKRQAGGVVSIIKEHQWGIDKVQERLYPNGRANAGPGHTNYLSRDIAQVLGEHKYKDLVKNWDEVGGRMHARDFAVMSQGEFDDYMTKLAPQ